MESGLSYLIKNYADYNHWANCTLINWLKMKPRDILSQEVPSSFSTIRNTLIHILDTQRYWLSILDQTAFYSQQDFDGDLDDVFQAVMAQSQALAEFVETLSTDIIQADTLIVSEWFECNLPNFEYIIHCMNHSTYHRGQIVTIGRNLGFTDAPMTDYNFYNVVAK